jgi:hypothetical protein
MIFSLDVCRARKGDCLLLHFGSKNTPGLVMIDGGPRNVYTPHLKPRLQQIRAARDLTDQQALNVDLLMVSHVDDDHIQGILELTKEMVETQDKHRPLPLNVLGFWHNSFDAIIGSEPEELTAAFRKQFGQASLSGGLPNNATLDEDVEFPDGRPDDGIINDNLKVLASIEQGFRLRTDAKKLGFPLNEDFGGKLIIAAADGEDIEVGEGLMFKVVGPMQPELAALHKKHQAWLKELKEKGKSPPAALAAYVDKSVPNLSSIVVLAKAGGQRMLLTGDARGDKILQGLQFVGELGGGKESTMAVDLLKVPHHGSANNLDNDFFERIIARHYVFSGNGEHGNPERESLQMLLEARGEDDDFTIHLTYPIDELDVEREIDWKKEQAKEKKRKEKNPNVKVRKNWSPAEHSLTAFFEDHKKLARKIRIVSESKPHLVDLLDPVKF